MEDESYLGVLDNVGFLESLNLNYRDYESEDGERVWWEYSLVQEPEGGGVHDFVEDHPKREILFKKWNEVINRQKLTLKIDRMP